MTRWAALLVALLCLLAGPREVAASQDPAPPAKACRCADGEACWHFLNAPAAAPMGACPCPTCTPPRVHDGSTVPEGWNRECFVSRDVDCFLKRHAASWRLACSACFDAAKCCPRPHPERCPACQEGDAKSPWPRDGEKTARERLAVERKVFTKEPPVCVVGRRFYVVTDIQRIKLQVQGGGFRVATGHEYAHVLLTRAEVAWREFRDAFGMPALGRPVGIFVPSRETTARALQGVYFRNPRAQMIHSSYGGSSQSAISEGFCLNGFCISAERFDDDDAKLHQALRHLCGNVFFSNWVVQSGEARSCPPWAFEGLAHWLGRRPPALADHVYYCTGEDDVMTGSGKGWLLDLQRDARAGNLRPIDGLLAARALGQLEQRDVQQVWGWFHVAMEDAPKAWAQLLQEVRRETDVHAAFRKAFGFGAAEFQSRFAARLLGTRKHLLDGDAPRPAAPAERTRDEAPSETAARLRATPPPRDRAGVEALLALASRSEAVREAAYTLLLQVKAAEAREAIWSAGLASPEPLVRAYAARLCRELRIAEARPALRRALDDASWLVRAEAAMAALVNRDFDAQARVREMLSDRSAKARIGASDALRMLGKDEANPLCVPALVANLAHADWQVRIATCQALAVLGDVRAVGPLVERLPVEGGRVAEEIRTALRAITYDDLGDDPEAWRKWWERTAPEAREGGFRPPEVRPGDERYGGKPKEYGIELTTHRLGFVVDTSRSTQRAFTPDAATAELLLGGRTQATVQDVIRGRVQHWLKGRDARTRFNAWTFGTSVSTWNKGLVPATGANVEDVVAFLRARPPDGETDFHLALRTVLDLRDGDDAHEGFRDTPDTVVLLTDGTATAGDITDPEVLRRWFAGLDRYARVRLHTFAVGALEVDERLLGGLAADSGGAFVQLRELNPR